MNRGFRPPRDPRRPYALDMLHCAACGTRLTGDTGYYRHREACETFVAARPPHHGRGRTNGHAYRREIYEQIVEAILGEASVGAAQVAAVVGTVASPNSGPDQRALDRVTRERERAMARYLRDRDAKALDQAMGELDRQQTASSEQPREESVPAEVAVAYLRELPVTWSKADGGQGRRLLATALFDRIEVLGLQRRRPSTSARTRSAMGSQRRCLRSWEYP